MRRMEMKREVETCEREVPPEPPLCGPPGQAWSGMEKAEDWLLAFDWKDGEMGGWKEVGRRNDGGSLLPQRSSNAVGVDLSTQPHPPNQQKCEAEAGPCRHQQRMGW